MTPPFGNLFAFERLDVQLEPQWLADHLGLSFGAQRLKRLRQIDNPSVIEDLYDLGRRAATTTVDQGRRGEVDLKGSALKVCERRFGLGWSRQPCERRLRRLKSFARPLRQGIDCGDASLVQKDGTSDGSPFR